MRKPKMCLIVKNCDVELAIKIQETIREYNIKKGKNEKGN